ncbi:hypothetical protein [Pareuzebyella sediminis]|uniref:hypothetical protein n=1 Tax=Pareuzebyella sediminis TaxID=2607998 RepID=UPI0011EF7EEB|nr:hypothetical protein [Pareuzebyella sediminis]
MANYQLQIREMNEYFKSIGHFSLDAVKERPFRKFHVDDNDGCNRRAFYIQHILGNLEKNANLKREFQKKEEEIIREYFHHQARLELQGLCGHDGSEQKLSWEEVPDSLLNSIEIYFEMAENVVEIFKKHG